MAASELLTALGTSQPTLSRTIHQIPDSFQFRVSGVRTPRYGIVRRLPGNLGGQQKVFRIDAHGSIAEVGTVCLLAGGETFLQIGTTGRLYAGLPPAMAFAAPSGFLGRQAAHAGGEQPKFLAFTKDRGHVLVKFAALGTRMAELLRMESLALDCLRGVGVTSAATQLLEHDGFAYLEVERFDRVGRHGRVGLLSAGALDDELFGHRDSWSQFAQRCESARILNADQTRRVHIMAAFSELIGNSDRHFENISLRLDAEGAVADVAPAYDILPMKYAPIGAGVEPELEPIMPKLGPIGVRAGVWGVASSAALTFWERCRDDATLGLAEPMRAVAARNFEAVRQFVTPLVPAHEATARGSGSARGW